MINKGNAKDNHATVNPLFVFPLICRCLTWIWNRVAFRQDTFSESYFRDRSWPISCPQRLRELTYHSALQCLRKEIILIVLNCTVVQQSLSIPFPLSPCWFALLPWFAWNLSASVFIAWRIPWRKSNIKHHWRAKERMQTPDLSMILIKWLYKLNELWQVR